MSQLLSNSSGVACNSCHWLGRICVLRCMNIIRNVLSEADIRFRITKLVLLRL